MSVSLDINDAGQAVLLIPEPDGQIFQYRFRPLPRGLSLWALEVVRADTGATYRVEELSPGRWTCSCPLQQKGRRREKPCKHIRHVRNFRAWLDDFLRSTQEVAHDKRTDARVAV